MHLDCHATAIWPGWGAIPLLWNRTHCMSNAFALVLTALSELYRIGRVGGVFA